MTIPLLSSITKVEAIGSKKHPTIVSTVIEIYFTILTFCLDILTSYKVIKLFVHTKKLKSSPKQKLKSNIFNDLGN